MDTKNAMPGTLVVLEGGEGSGKSSVARWLAQRLKDAGTAVTLTKEPSDQGSAGLIRQLLLTGEPDKFSGTSELLLFAAARVEHLRAVVMPALCRGDIVICDRFVASTVAYQGYGRGLDAGLIRDLHARTAGGIEPDLTLLLDVDPRVGLARSSKRLSIEQSAEGRFEALELEFHERVRKGFHDQAAAAVAGSWEVISAEAPVEDVRERSMAAVSRHLSLIAGTAAAATPRANTAC